jgi:protoporphyrinogen oxidase
MKLKKVLVLGAGLSGLTVGLKLCEQGYNVSIVEERDIVGGQALSINQNGATFDLGPHAWHTLLADLNSLYFDICGEENVSVFPKNAGIFFHEKSYDYPLKLTNLVKSLPIGTAFVSFFRYVTRPRIRIVSAEDFFISTYGEKLYEIFFKDYTERTWGIPPSHIDRKFFYKRVPSLSLFQLLLRTLFGPLLIRKAKHDDDPGYAYEVKMIYPKKGSGFFPNNMAQRIRNLGGEIHSSAPVVCINHDQEKIRSIAVAKNGKIQNIECDYCISSIPITSFVKNLDPQIDTLTTEVDSLFYRAIIIVCLIVNREHISDYQTIYFYNNVFTRIGIMNNFSSTTCPRGKTALTAELTCFEGDEIWNAKPHTLKDLVADELVELGFFDKKDVEDYTIIRDKYGYPVLKVGDPDKLQYMFKCLDSIKNLSVIGRQGRFDYIQMADAVRGGIYASRKVIQYFEQAESH